ncbi:MAG: restriction endonuclease subunit S [Rikenellaceae bacterium]
MSDWQKVRLGDICTLYYGKALTATKRVAGDTPVYSSAGITGWHKKSLIDSRAIIIGRKGTVGSVYLCETPFWCIDTAYFVLPNDDVYNFKYLYYRLSSLGLNKLNEDSAVPGLNRDTAYSQEFNLPPLEEQRRIADVLSSLDDKIELNNRINKNLESQASALFKRWFVDFEYVPLSSIIDVRDGTHDSPKRVDQGKYLITSKHLLPNGAIDYSSAYQISNDDFEQINRRSKVCKFDILFSMIGTIGNMLIVNNDDIDFAIKNVALIRTSNKVEYTYFLYLYLNSDWCNEYIQSRLAGSTQQYVTLGTLREMPIPSIAEERLNEFNKIIFPIFDAMNNNRGQNQHLIELRDSLLPKLMNNEI